MSPIAVLASTNTWNAYNPFGGRSNYLCPSGLEPKPTVNSRQDLPRFRGGPKRWSKDNIVYPPLSFERPEPFNGVPLNDEWKRNPADEWRARSLRPTGGDWRGSNVKAGPTITTLTIICIPASSIWMPTVF